MRRPSGSHADHGLGRILALGAALLCVQFVVVGSAQAAVGSAAAGGSTYSVAGINTERLADQLVVYTYDTSRTVSPANQWGAEAAVLDGTVKEVRDRQTTGQSGTPIPVGGTVLSGHGAARLWILANVHVGQVVSFPGSGVPVATGTPTATINGSTRAVAGTDVARLQRTRSSYTPPRAGRLAPPTSGAARRA